MTDAEPADGDEQEYICLMKVVLDEQSATCGLVREGSELRADVASDDDALRRRLRKLLERTLRACRSRLRWGFIWICRFASTAPGG